MIFRLQKDKIELFCRTPYFKGLLGVFLTYLLLPRVFVIDYLCDRSRVGLCLDESWATSINLAIQNQFIFGKDYIFTYGPLGFLATRDDVGISHIYFVLFDIFILSNLCFIVTYVLRKHYQLYPVCILFLAVLSISNIDMYTANIGFVMLLLSLFWLSYAQKNLSNIGILVSLLITVILFFIKLNSSFIALLIFYLYLVYLAFFTKEKLIYKIQYFFAAPILIFLLSFPLNVDLKGYVISGLSFISSYNDSMNTIDSFTIIYTAVAALCVLICCFVVYGSFSAKNLVSVIAFSILTFVIFKQAFVRGDVYHVTAFFSVFPFLCLILFLFQDKMSKSKSVLTLVIALLCLIVPFRIGLEGISLKRNIFPSINRIDYLYSLANQNHFMEANVEWYRLPSEIKDEIGRKTVDIIPWEVNVIYCNELNYRPRPVVQSYAVTDSYLISQNGEKYNSENGPDYVVFSNQTIDDRYAMFDDSAAKLALIQNYSFSKSFTLNENDYLLFKKKKNDMLYVSPVVEETAVRMGEDYQIKDTNKAYLMKIDVNYSIFGNALRFAYQPISLMIIFTLEDGTTYKFRALVSILKSGVVVNPFIQNEQDFLRFAEGKWQSNSKKISRFRIEPISQGYFKKVGSAIYQDKIKITTSEMLISPKTN